MYMEVHSEVPTLDWMKKLSMKLPNTELDYGSISSTTVAFLQKE